MRELQVATPDRAGMGRVDRAGRLCEADEEAGPYGRGAEAAHALETGRRSRGRVRQAGGLRELRIWSRPDDREQDPREDARYREGVPERSLRGETQVRHDAALLERATGQAETIFVIVKRPRTLVDGVETSRGSEY